MGDDVCEVASLQRDEDFLQSPVPKENVNTTEATSGVEVVKPAKPSGRTGKWALREAP